MNPTISAISEENDIYRFTLANINVSLANAIRRTIITDIPINIIQTETYATNQCHIEINTSRLHNEILKHRISCIPIHIKELDLLPDKYVLEINVKNETDEMIYVTTEDFKIRNKNNDHYLTKEETRKIFPPCPKTNYFIDFMRLRPKIGDNIQGEQIKLIADFTIGTAKSNSMFNVVSKCAYGNTIDAVKVNEQWEKQETKLQSENLTKEEIEFQKKNFYLLDAQRHFKVDSFDFVIQTIGIYENKEIVKKACTILIQKFALMIEGLDSDIIPINHSESTMNYCFDVILENEDYTMGKVLEYLLYEKYYQQEKIFSFCGFKKFHPHNTDSVIRVSYVSDNDKNTLRQHLRMVALDAIEIFRTIHSLF